MSEPDYKRYYTTNFTSLPISYFISVWIGQPLFAKLVLPPYYLLGKIFGFPAIKNAFAVPDNTKELELNEVPVFVVNGLKDYEQECHAQKMRHIGYYEEDVIGNVRKFKSLFISEDGKTYCSCKLERVLDKVEISVSLDKTLSLTSFTESGDTISTSTSKYAHRTPNTPEDVSLTLVPIETAAAEVIKKHTSTLTEYDDVMEYNKDSIMDKIQKNQIKLEEEGLKIKAWGRINKKTYDRLVQDAAEMVAFEDSLVNDTEDEENDE